ncbi:MAG: M24 family metallopeptidase [Dehalococcoidia bacterium]
MASLPKARFGDRAQVIEAMKPGVTSGDVDNACRGAVIEAGCGENYHYRTGYSIGLGYAPGRGEGHIMDLKPNDPQVIRAGMAFHLVPVLFIEEKVGIGFSETALVTETGSEPLCEYPRKLIIV